MGLFFIIVQGVLFVQQALLETTIISQALVAIITYTLLTRIFTVENTVREHAFAFTKYLIAYLAIAGTTYLLTPHLTIFISAPLFFLALYIAAKIVVFRRQQLPSIFSSPWFILPLLVKASFASLFASDHLRSVLQLVKAYAATTANSYDLFLGTQTLINAYPLSPTILLILGTPFAFIATLAIPPTLELFIIRLPLLIADIGILYLLYRLLPSKGKELLLFYWCSPIILYVTYMQGQLDIIPIFILLAAIYAIIKEQELLGMVLLAIGIAAKANVLIAVPFIFLYLLRKRIARWLLPLYAAIVITIPLLLLLPLRSSPGFAVMLDLARAEIARFVLSSPLMLSGFTLYLVPLLLILFGLRLSYYRIMNIDMLLMSLGVAFIILVILVPPLSGWFLWSLPFIIYFFIKNTGVSRNHLYLFSAAFLLYFILLSPESDFFRTFQMLHPALAQLPAPVFLLPFSATVLSNLGFTLLAGTMVINSIWVYNYGLIGRFEKMRPFIIGIAGDSGTGKSSLNTLLAKLFGERHIVFLEGDDMHRWQRGDKNWERFTHLDPRANRLHQDLAQIRDISKRRIARQHYDHATGRFTKPKVIEGGKFTVISGLHSLYLEDMRKRLDLKIFLDPDPALQVHWKVQRDIGERNYTRARVEEQIRRRMKDRKAHIQPQRQFADVIISYRPRVPMTKKQVWDTAYNPQLMLELQIVNSIDVERIIAELQTISSLQVSTTFNKDLRTQRLVIKGRITREDIERIAYSIADIDSITEYYHPEFKDGLEGVLQLVLLSIISESVIVRENQ